MVFACARDLPVSSIPFRFLAVPAWVVIAVASFSAHRVVGAHFSSSSQYPLSPLPACMPAFCCLPWCACWLPLGLAISFRGIWLFRWFLSTVFLNHLPPFLPPLLRSQYHAMGNLIWLVCVYVGISYLIGIVILSIYFATDPRAKGVCSIASSPPPLHLHCWLADTEMARADAVQTRHHRRAFPCCTTSTHRMVSPGKLSVTEYLPRSSCSVRTVKAIRGDAPSLTRLTARCLTGPRQADTPGLARLVRCLPYALRLQQRRCVDPDRQHGAVRH